MMEGSGCRAGTQIRKITTGPNPDSGTQLLVRVPSSWCRGLVARRRTSAQRRRPGAPAAECPPAASPAGSHSQTEHK